MSSRRDGQIPHRPLLAIPQRGLTQTVYALLRAKIGSHDFASGERLRLDVLADQLGVSRTPVREALNQLALEGLIEIRPRRGTFVARVDQRSVAELYELRLMIDTHVGRQVARNIRPAQVRRLRQLFAAIEAQVSGDAYHDYGAYLAADRAFHSAIVALAENQRLISLYEEINLPLWLVRAQQDAGLERDHDAAASLAGHREILEALVHKDADRAARAVADHIQFARVRLDSWLGSGPAGANARLHSNLENARS